MRVNLFWWVTLVMLGLSGAGCGGFMARRMAQAPNTYPEWIAPEARVLLAVDSRCLTNFPARYVNVGPPPARLRYRIVEPGDYGVEYSATNWLERGRAHFRFSFRTQVPGKSTGFSGSPRGTVLLLHGYGMSQAVMAPWALRLAQEGWRCVLVDLRGHGRSTGARIYFGVQEVHDLSQLLDELSRQGQLVEPVAALGESYGAALALRWPAAEPRVHTVVALAPYAELSHAMLNIRHEYARWVPQACVRAGLNRLPSLLQTQPGEFDPATVLRRTPVLALFVAGDEDKVAPVAEVTRLCQQAAPGSELLVVPRATHEALAYFFNDLVGPVLAWLKQADTSARRPSSFRRDCTLAPGRE